MGIIIGILTGILVVVCIFLVLIILMQKSKQEAGVRAALGGAATEQLFGAGTTSVLTKATIWGTAMFFVITKNIAVPQMVALVSTLVVPAPKSCSVAAPPSAALTPAS